MNFSHKLKWSVKRRVLALIEMLPWGQDLYRRYWIYPRANDSFRGVFADMDSAIDSIGTNRNSGYDRNNQRKSLEHELGVVDSYFQDSDYPALFWLSRAMNAQGTVLELGGSVGYSYFGFRRFFEYPDGLRWTIVELPGAVRLGLKIAAQRHETALTFVESVARDFKASIYLTSGTLQYMPETLSSLLGQLDYLPDHVIVNRVPVTPDDSFWTIQNVGVNELPYKVSNREQFVQSVTELGYEMVDSWRTGRQLVVPFSNKQDADEYCGFYFRRPDI